MEVETFLKDHPEYRRQDTEPLEGMRMGSKRVLSGYEQLPQDKVLPAPASRSLAQRVLVVKVEKALEKLPAKRADLLRRIYWERQTQHEVAAALGISQQAVAQRLRVAERHLKRVYDPNVEVKEEEL